MLALVKNFWKEERGQGMTEYGLILALIVLAVVGVLVMLGDDLYNKFDEVRTELNQP